MHKFQFILYMKGIIENHMNMNITQENKVQRPI